MHRRRLPIRRTFGRQRAQLQSTSCFTPALPVHQPGSHDRQKCVRWGSKEGQTALQDAYIAALNDDDIAAPPLLRLSAVTQPQHLDIVRVPLRANRLVTDESMQVIVAAWEQLHSLQILSTYAGLKRMTSRSRDKCADHSAMPPCNMYWWIVTCTSWTKQSYDRNFDNFCRSKFRINHIQFRYRFSHVMVCRYNPHRKHLVLSYKLCVISAYKHHCIHGKFICSDKLCFQLMN
jgi:hypothetical protein